MAAKSQTYIKRQAEGLCVSCGEQPPSMKKDGSGVGTQCDTCKRRQAKRAKKLREKRKAAGMITKVESRKPVAPQAPTSPPTKASPFDMIEEGGIDIVIGVLVGVHKGEIEIESPEWNLGVNMAVTLQTYREAKK